MSDTADDRRGQLIDAVYERFAVEAPEVLDAAAATHQQQTVMPLAVRLSQRFDQRFAGSRSLHIGRIQRQLCDRPAFLNGGDHILQGRPLLCGDDGDIARVSRDRLLVRIIEPAFIEQFFLQLFIAQVEIPDAVFPDRRHIALHAALLFIHRDRSLDDHLHAVLDRRLTAGSIRRKHHAGQTCLLILQGKIPVPAAMLLQI